MKTNELDVGKLYFDSHHQRAESAGVIFRIADRGFNGELARVFWSGERPYGWTPPNMDERWKESKKFRQAHDAVYEALRNYDAARTDLKVRAERERK